MQGQFPCPECGQPILIMLHRKGDVARCLWCGAHVPVPGQLDSPETQKVLTKLETAKQLTVDEEFEQLSAVLSPAHRGIVEECKGVAGIGLSRNSAQFWFLSYETQSPSEFWIEITLGSELMQMTVGTENDHTHVEWMLEGQPMKALEWFRKGLSGEMRLVVSYSTGGDLYHDVEMLEGGKWKRIAGGRGCIPLFRPKVVGTRVLINHVLPPPSSEAL